MNKLSTDVRLLITINNLIYYFHIIQLYELFIFNNVCGMKINFQNFYV